MYWMHKKTLGAIALALLLASAPLAAHGSGKDGADYTVDIWEGTACHKKVMLSTYLPKDTTQAPLAHIVVCPGGSYYWLDKENEGSCVGRWLASKGIAAHVLHYRVAGAADFVTGYRVVFRGNRHPDMLHDLERALSLVRLRAHGRPVGAMGFSAGGHLVLSAGIYGAWKPDFICAAYPVVTLREKGVAHRRSRRGLLGTARTGNRVLRDSLSLERHVPKDMPPVFLFNCVDDPVVDERNAQRMDDALRAAGIADCVYLRFEKGGHGFGANAEKMNAETATWQPRFLDWLRSLTLSQREDSELNKAHGRH